MCNEYVSEHRSTLLRWWGGMRARTYLSIASTLAFHERYQTPRNKPVFILILETMHEHIVTKSKDLSRVS